MTAIHLSAKHGHTNILEALKGHVSWRVTSKKVIKFDSPFGGSLFTVAGTLVNISLTKSTCPKWAAT
jgi:hypothetical protein